jgi:hypothetical protein
MFTIRELTQDPRLKTEFRQPLTAERASSTQQKYAEPTNVWFHILFKTVYKQVLARQICVV